jgi:hypothetical protein
MSVHPLILCSRVLYDVQLSEDAATIAMLKEDKKHLEQDCERLAMCYTYLSSRDCGGANDFDDGAVKALYRTACDARIFDEISPTTTTKTNVLFYLMNLFDVSFEIDNEPTDNNIHMYPYRNCSKKDVDLVFHRATQTLLLGKRFWNSTALKDQDRVYRFKYMIGALSLSEDDPPEVVEGTVLFILEHLNSAPV